MLAELDGAKKETQRAILVKTSFERACHDACLCNKRLKQQNVEVGCLFVFFGVSVVNRSIFQFRNSIAEREQHWKNVMKEISSDLKPFQEIFQKIYPSVTNDAQKKIRKRKDDDGV